MPREREINAAGAFLRALGPARDHAGALAWACELAAGAVAKQALHVIRMDTMDMPDLAEQARAVLSDRETHLTTLRTLAGLQPDQGVMDARWQLVDAYERLAEHETQRGNTPLAARAAERGRVERAQLKPL